MRHNLPRESGTRTRPLSSNMGQAQFCNLGFLSYVRGYRICMTACGAIPAILSQIYTAVRTKPYPFLFQTLPLEFAAAASSWTDAAPVIDDAMPGHIRVEGQARHGIPHHAGTASSDQTCDLSVSGYLTVRNLAYGGIDAPVRRIRIR